MKLRILVWMLFAFALGLVACSKEEVAGVSTVETDNACIIQIVNDDFTPAANVTARVRPANYLSGDGLENDGVLAEYLTDSSGYFTIDSLMSDSETVEVVNGNRGVFTTIYAKNIQKKDSLQLVMNRLGTLKGKVALSEGESPATVEIYGTGKSAKTDSSGNYEIDSLPPATYRIHIVTANSEMDDTVAVKEGPKMVSLIDFESGTLRNNLKTPALEGTGYLAVTDTSVKTNPLPDSALKGIETASAGREGLAFHWTSSSEKSGLWSLFGLWICHEDTPCDFSALDSVVYYIRGTGRYSFAMESMGDSNYQGKTLFNDSLDAVEKWIRKTVRPSDFAAGDSLWGNFGWEAIHDKITNIVVSAYGESEIWLDDIEFYGVDEKDMK